MKDESLVSIIVPVFNAEKYLSECIESILLQSYENIEVLLVNDGSQDKSGKICEEYAVKDSRIKTLHQDNMGPSAARNKGIHHSKGMFLQFADADDQLEPSMVEKLVNHKSKADLVLCGYKAVNDTEKKRIVEEVSPSRQGYYLMEEFMKFFSELFKKNLINSPCNKLYDANIVKNHMIKFDTDIRQGEDLLFNIKYLQFCSEINIINNSLYLYIKTNNSTSLTKKYKVHYFDNRLKILNELSKLVTKYQNIVPENKELIYEVSTDYLVLSLSNIYNYDSRRSWKKKKKEINNIINSNWVQKNIHNFKISNLQEKLVIFLVKRQFYNGMHIYFFVKNFLRKNAKTPYNILRKFN